MAMNEDTIGQRLRYIRKTLGFTAKDVEKLTNHRFKEKTVLSWEREDVNISTTSFVNLCNFYGVNPGDVLNPSFDTISLRGLDKADAKAIRNMVTHLRRKSISEEESGAS